MVSNDTLSFGVGGSYWPAKLKHPMRSQCSVCAFQVSHPAGTKLFVRFRGGQRMAIKDGYK